ncbi:MAG: response regulator [Deltaproteobacteria bacterium]|nr:response regulator [Deltaproteobacteria bacterium]
MERHPDIPEIEIGQELGHGAFSIVYRARCRGEPCAVKLPRSRGRWTRWVYREAVALARIRHPALPAVLDVGEVDGLPYLAMELVEGRTLARHLADQRLSETEIIDLAIRLTDALGAVHAAGLVHRDVKPRNIVMGPGGSLRLIDFGFATPMERTNGTDSDAAGTPGFAAPEQFDAPARVDNRSDLFAVGRVITACLESTRRERDSRATWLGAIVESLVAPDPDERYPDAHSLRSDLERARDGVAPRGAAAYQRERTIAPLVGRTRELQRLVHGWAQITTAGSVTIVRGRRGAGKTHLLATAVQRVKALGPGAAFDVSAREGDVPLATLRRLFSAILRPGDDGKPLPAVWSALSSEELRSFARVIVPDHPSLADAPASVDTATPEAFAESASEILLAIAKAMGRLLIAVDDFQWVDPMSREVLVRTGSRTREAPIMLLLGARTSAEHTTGSVLPPEADVIGLPPLSSNETSALIASYLGDSTVDDDLARRVTALADGTPLGVLEVLGAFLDAGVLRPHARAWAFDVDRADSVGLPRGTLALLGRRVGDLPAASRRVLEAASMIGSSFADALLARVIGVAEPDLDYALVDARQAGILDRAERGAHCFVHESLREELASGVSESERRRLHLRIADELESRTPLSLDTVCAVADHVIAADPADEPERVYRTTRRAAEGVLARFDNDTAIRYLHAARAAAERGGLALDVSFHVDFGEAQLRVGALEQSLESFRAALARAGHPTARAVTLGRIAWVHQAQSRPEESWSALHKAFEELGTKLPSDGPVSAARTLESLGRIELEKRWRRRDLTPEAVRRAEVLCDLHYQSARLSFDYNRPLRLILSALEARRLSSALGPSRASARAGALFGFLVASLGRREAGIREIEEAKRMASELRDPATAAFCVQLEGVVEGVTGDFDKAFVLTRECIQHYGNWLELNEYCQHIANADFAESLRGRPREAWWWLSQGLGRLQRSRHKNATFAAFLVARAKSVLAALGRDPADERSMAAELGRLEEPPTSASGFYRLVSWGPRARFLLETGKLGAEFEALVAEFAEEKHNPRTAHIMLAEYYVAVAHARITQCLSARSRGAVVHLEELRRAASALRAAAKVPLVEAHSVLADAHLAWLEGQTAKAKELFARAESIASEQTCPWVLSCIARARAAMLREQGRNDAAIDQARIAEMLARAHGAEARARVVRDELGLPNPVVPFSAAASRRTAASSRRIRRQLASILHVVKAPLTDARPDDQAVIVLDNLLADLDAESGYLWFEPDGSPAASAIRLGRNRSGETITQAMSWCDVILRHVRAVRVSWPAVEDDPSFGGLDVALDVRRVLAIPLFVNDVVVGAACLQRRAGDPPFTFEDRELFDLLSSQVPISLEICRLMAEREQLRTSMQHMQKMEAVGRLAAGVAHDFNNTLSVVTTSVAMLREHGNLTDYAADDVTLIADATQRATDLAKRLLAFSRHQPGPRTRVDPNVAIAELGPLIKRAMVKDHKVETRLEAHGYPIDVDRATFDAAVINLAVNARDATEAHGTITITTKDVVLGDADVRNGAPSTGNYVAIEVTDTGCGIPHENLSRIFEPFFTTKGPGGGTGLGLTMVYAFAKNSGGCVFVESDVGKGTTFRIMIPRADASRPMPVSASHFPRKLLTPNRYKDDRAILLVDDDAGVRESMKRVLQQAGYRVLTAANAVEALNTVSRVAAQISLVILDVMMPGMTGPELAQKLLTMNLHAKVLFVSGYAPNDIPVEIGSVTNEMLLQKPFAPADLLARVDELVMDP